MRLPERLQQVLIVGLLRVIDHPDDFGVPRLAGANLFVCRIGRKAAGVTHGGRVHARELPDQPLGAPEAPRPNTASRRPAGMEGRCGGH